MKQTEKTKSPPEKLYTIRETSQIINRTYASIWTNVRTGKLPAKKCKGGKMFIRESTIKKLLGLK